MAFESLDDIVGGPTLDQSLVGGSLFDDDVVGGPTLPGFHPQGIRPEEGPKLMEFQELSLGSFKIPLWSRQAMEQYPKLYGATGAYLGTILDVIPYAKFSLPEHREAFKQLSEKDQRGALLWEAASVALWGAAPLLKSGIGAVAPVIGKFAGKVGKRVLAGRQKVLMQPIEDVVVWKETSYDTAIRNLLGKKMQKGYLNLEEREVIKTALGGDREVLFDWLHTGVEGRKTTKQFMDMLDVDVGGVKPGFRLKKWVTDKYTPEGVRNMSYLDEFESAIKASKVYGDDVFKKSHAEAAYKAMSIRFFGKDVAKGMKISNASVDQLGNFSRELLQGTQSGKGTALALIQKTGEPMAFSSFKPIRIVYGLGEEVFGTFSGIYERIKLAQAVRNTRVIDHVSGYREMLVQNKLMKRKKTLITRKTEKHGIPQFTRVKEFTPAMGRLAYETMDLIDKHMYAVFKGGATKETLAQGIKEVNAFVNSFGENKPLLRTLISVSRSMEDVLYKEYMQWAIPEVFKSTKYFELTSGGSKVVKYLMEGNPATGKLGLLGRIDDLFSTKRGVPIGDKLVEIEKILMDARMIPKTLLEKGGESMVSLKEGGDLVKIASRWERKLSTAPSYENFPNYFSNHVGRIAEGKKKLANEIFNVLGGGGSAFYKRMSTSMPILKKTIDFDSRMSMRITSQMSEMYFHKPLLEAAEFAKTLPKGWKNFTEHYLARELNLPSKADEAYAKGIQFLIGPLERAVGKPGIWDAKRVISAAMTFNDFTYMGFLGFKPFSAMRNLFQPFLLVPADLGGGHLFAGIKNFETLAKGMVSATNPATRKYLQEMGVITEYAPELIHSGKIFRFGKTIKGFELPTIDAVRDAAMLMFKGSDRWNRYITGASAKIKFEEVLRKMAISEKQTKLSTKQIAAVMRKTGSNQRRDWMRVKIEDSLSRGRIKEAKDIYIKDVAADTQFLYGKSDSPIFSQTMGAAGKQMAVFQSWWMNYGSLLAKWVSTGTSGVEKADQIFTWMVSSAAAYQVMKPMWGARIAKQTSWVGPFPNVGEGVPVPVAWKPPQLMFSTIFAAVDVLTAGGPPKKVLTQASRLLGSVISFAPGGLFWKTLYRGGKEEGFEGFLKEIIRYRGGD